MNIFEVELLNVIFIIAPFTIYLFYVVYNRNISKKENKLFLELALFSSLYLSLKYGVTTVGTVPILIVNIPLLIAFWFNRNFSSIIISIILVLYYYTYFDFNLATLILEYLFYYVLYLVFITYYKKSFLFASTFILSKMVLVVIQAKYVGLMELFTKEQLGTFLISIGLFYFSALLTIYLIKKGDDIIKYHMNVKKLEENEQIQVSLFKITHEIKNPIAVCKGYLDMFDVNNMEHSKKYIPIIRSEIERTLLLLQDFLAVSKLKIEKDILDINLLLEDVVYNFKTIMKEKKINLDFVLDEDEELFINGDYNRLSQVIINVLKNSIEAIKLEGTIKIRVEETERLVKINIQDDGIGIENISKIGEPFFTTKKNGTGLGVPLSQEIIKAHDGKIKYFSKLNQGTLVTITLPKDLKAID